jgi:hypothetical protein
VRDDTGACLVVDTSRSPEDGLVHWRTHHQRNIEWTTKVTYKWAADCEYHSVRVKERSMLATGSTSFSEVTCLACLAHAR